MTSAPIHEKHEETTWEKCTLRQYLNDDFLADYFSETEAQRIALTQVVNDDHSKYGVLGSNDTEDRVFVLSRSKTYDYFKSNSERVAIYLDHADSWWLRSPSIDARGAAFVCDDGSIDTDGIDNYDNGVRPALWLSLEHV